jgi:ankyrin repeat protein
MTSVFDSNFSPNFRKKKGINLAQYVFDNGVHALLVGRKNLGLSTGSSTGLSKRHRKCLRRHGNVIVRCIEFATGDPNATDHRGYTALHWAARYNWEMGIKILVNTHRQPHMQPTNLNPVHAPTQSTPLDIAAELGHMESVKMLLKLGALVQPRTSERGGESTRDKAEREDQQEIVALIDRWERSKERSKERTSCFNDIAK